MASAPVRIDESVEPEFVDSDEDADEVTAPIRTAPAERVEAASNGHATPEPAADGDGDGDDDDHDLAFIGGLRPEPPSAGRGTSRRRTRRHRAD